MPRSPRVGPGFPALRVALALAIGLAPGGTRAEGQPSAACGSFDACRAAALAAEAAAEGEAFHDLAWRTMRFRPNDDPATMYLVARAQAASGRSSDALVMLRRLAQAGVATDAADLEVFARVRDRDGWPEVEALTRTASRRIVREAVVAAPAVAEAPSAPAAAETESAVVPGHDATNPEMTATAAAVAAAPAYGRVLTADVALRLDDALDSVAGGFAYDAVSGRYLVGDREARKIVVVDEPSRRVADLVRGDSAGFRQLVAMEIDTRRGDLWVLSNDTAGDGTSARATLHKLQLVAGRPLGRIEAPADAGGVRFTDLAVAADGSVLVVDADGRRLYRVAPRGTALVPLMTLDLPTPESITLDADGTVAFVAHAGGVSRVDVSRRRVDAVQLAAADAGAAIDGVWWHDGALVVLRTDTAGARTLQRWKLDRRGTSVIEIRRVEMALPDAPTPVAITLSGSSLLILTGAAPRAAGADDVERAILPVVRRVRLGP